MCRKKSTWEPLFPGNSVAIWDFPMSVVLSSVYSADICWIPVRCYDILGVQKWINSTTILKQFEVWWKDLKMEDLGWRLETLKGCFSLWSTQPTQFIQPLSALEEIGMELPYACFFSLLCDSSMLLTVFPLLFSNVLVLYRIIYPVNCWRLLSWFLFGDLIGNGLGRCGCILVYVYTYLEMFFRNKIQGL